MPFFRPISPLILLLAAAQPAVAQDSGDGSGQGASTIDLPLLGEVELPGFLSFLGSPPEKAQQGDRPPPAVVTTIAKVEPVSERFTFIGRVQPIERVEIVARVPGFIESVQFEGGNTVEAGDTLVQIDRGQYEAERMSAQASFESAQAQETEAERALSRAQELRDSGTVSQASLDEARATFEARRGTRLQAEAAVAQAQLNLDYTTLSAPIAGRMSAPLQTRGNYVTTGSGALAELVQLDPIWGVFALGETRLTTWRRLGIGGADPAPLTSGDGDGATASTMPVTPNPARPGGQAYDLTLLLPDGSRYLSAGSFDFIGNGVDPATGTLEVRVRFDNPDGVLVPNQNVTLRVTESDPPRYPVIPQAAVQLGRDGSSVWVVNDDDTVRRVSVTLETAHEPGRTAVTDGLAGGERVVIRGAATLQDGQTVSPRAEGATAAGGSGGGQGESAESGGSGEGSGGSGGDGSESDGSGDGSGGSSEGGGSGDSSGDGSGQDETSRSGDGGSRGDGAGTDG